MMQLVARVLLALVVVLSFISLSLAQPTDPSTHCAPVTVDAFSVLVGNGADVEGTMVAQVNGTYPIQQYYYQFAQRYAFPAIFMRVLLTPNSTILDQGTVGVSFTIALNGASKSTNGTAQVYQPDPVTGAADIELSFWRVAQSAINNTIQLNVTEVITVGQDVTQCKYVYTIIFNSPAVILPPARLIGDPQFVGLRGQSFQIHGVDGAVYNLISDKSMQLNSRFAFLTGPRPCPVIPSTGKASTACWTHPGSYVSALALMTVGGSKLSIVSGDAATGFASITVDGEVVAVGSTVQLDMGKSGLTGSITVDNTHEVTLHAGHFDLVVENNDGFVNLRQVSVLPSSWTQLASHGLLGQTWANKRYSGKVRYIEGDVDDYLIEDDNMFGDAFLYNRFTL